MTNEIYTKEYETAIFGVKGRMHNRIIDTETGLFRNQKFTSEKRPIKGYRHGATLQATICFDDECNNGHQTFAITAEVQEPRMYDVSACGCLHDDIEQIFPEFAPLIKWHLFDTSGPIHYISNTCYHAGNLDYNGRAKGEPSRWEQGIKFDDVPIVHTVSDKFCAFLKERHGTGDFQVVEFIHPREPDTYSPNYSFVGFGHDWYKAPFKNKSEADEFCEAMNKCRVEFVTIVTDYSEGKERNLKAARSCAVWPEATDEELSVPCAELEAALKARLPKLNAAFRADMEVCGFMWEQHK